MIRPDDQTSRPLLHLPVLVQLTTKLLRAGVPLSLLLDLTEPNGPNSTELFLAQGGRAAGRPRPG